MEPFWSNPLIFLPNYLFGIIHLESMFRLRRNQICTSRNGKSSQREILSKDAGLFIKIFFFSRCFSHIFAIANQLAGFSISSLASVEDFFNVYIFFIFSYIFFILNDYLFKYIYLVRKMLHLYLADFTTPNKHQRF